MDDANDGRTAQPWPGGAAIIPTESVQLGILTPISSSPSPPPPTIGAPTRGNGEIDVTQLVETDNDILGISKASPDRMKTRWRPARRRSI